MAQSWASGPVDCRDQVAPVYLFFSLYFFYHCFRAHLSKSVFEQMDCLLKVYKKRRDEDGALATEWPVEIVRFAPKASKGSPMNRQTTRADANRRRAAAKRTCRNLALQKARQRRDRQTMDLLEAARVRLRSVSWQGRVQGITHHNAPPTRTKNYLAMCYIAWLLACLLACTTLICQHLGLLAFSCAVFCIQNEQRCERASPVSLQRALQRWILWLYLPGLYLASGSAFSRRHTAHVH